MSFHGTQAKVVVKTANPLYTDWKTTDKVQSVSFDFAGSLEDIYMMGDRDPQEVKEGSIAISGTIERIFGVTVFSGSAVQFADLAIAPALLGWEVAIFPNGVAAVPKIMITGVKFGGYSISSDVGGIMTESITFHGLAIAVTPA